MKQLQTVFESVLAKETEVTIKGKQYRMLIWTAYNVCDFEQKYGINFFMEGLAKRPTSLLTEIAYVLLENIKDDYPTLDDFRKALDENEQRNSKIIEACFAAVGKFLTVKEVQSDSDEKFQGTAAEHAAWEAAKQAAGNGKGNILSKTLSWLFKGRNKKS